MVWTHCEPKPKDISRSFFIRQQPLNAFPRGCRLPPVFFFPGFFAADKAQFYDSAAACDRQCKSAPERIGDKCPVPEFFYRDCVFIVFVGLPKA
jgi:hypothetical protein